MGRCCRCGKKTGFLNSYCKDEVLYKYGDTLEVIDGFYKGQTGKLEGLYDCGWKSTWDYKIKLDDGTVIDRLDEREVRKINDGNPMRQS